MFLNLLIVIFLGNKLLIFVILEWIDLMFFDLNFILFGLSVLDNIVILMLKSNVLCEIILWLFMYWVLLLILYLFVWMLFLLWNFDCKLIEFKKLRIGLRNFW